MIYGYVSVYETDNNNNTSKKEDLDDVIDDSIDARVTDFFLFSVTSSLGDNKHWRDFTKVARRRRH